MRETIYLYENIKYGFIGCLRGNNHIDNDEDIRITEYIEVDFPERDKAEIVKSQVISIDAEMIKLRKQLEFLNAKKEELLAISHEELLSIGVRHVQV